MPRHERGRDSFSPSFGCQCPCVRIQQTFTQEKSSSLNTAQNQGGVMGVSVCKDLELLLPMVCNKMTSVSCEKTSHTASSPQMPLARRLPQEILDDISTAARHTHQRDPFLFLTKTASRERSGHQTSCPFPSPTCRSPRYPTCTIRKVPGVQVL